MYGVSGIAGVAVQLAVVEEYKMLQGRKHRRRQMGARSVRENLRKFRSVERLPVSFQVGLG